MANHKNTMETVANRIEIVDSGCWEWLGALQYGYGYTTINSVGCRVHRLVWEYLVCPIPDGLVLDHLCRNKKCCNVAHMEMVTQGENIRRGDVGKHNREKTHCVNGHPYSEENTYYITRKDGKGFRMCKSCNNAARERYTQRKIASQGAGTLSK
jgi:hypothetical protein